VTFLFLSAPKRGRQACDEPLALDVREPGQWMQPRVRGWRHFAFRNFFGGLSSFRLSSVPLGEVEHALPSSTSCCTSHDTRATWEYQGHCVSLLWQSKQARTASARTSGELQAGSERMVGFAWFRPYGTS
jgi:hypothetical protein